MQRHESNDKGDVGLKARKYVAVAASVIGLVSCQSQSRLEIPQSVDVKTYLMQMPMGISEELNESSTFPLRGKVGACRAKENCQVDVYQGDIFLSLSIKPEMEGNFEISISSIDDVGVTFTRKVQFRYSDTSYDNQMIKYDDGATGLFNTNLTVSVIKKDRGATIELRD